MTRGDKLSGESGGAFGDDAIYAEAYCRPKDVFHEGSEDEAYESPSVRRRQYEEAGQRFLAGGTPLILSASLNGPFDNSSGWINPWLSNSQKANSLRRNKGSRSIRPYQKGSLQTRADDCHLPSPESLKQAPYARPNAYLESTDIADARGWRQTSDQQSTMRRGFWSSDSSGASTPTKAKRSGGAEKRNARLVNRMRSQLGNTGLARPEEEDGLDELLADNPVSPLDLVSPVMVSKTTFARSGAFGSQGSRAVISEDELSPSKAAAIATLSSPVSLKYGGRGYSIGKSKPVPACATSSVATQTTPSILRHVDRCVPAESSSQEPERTELLKMQKSPLSHKAKQRRRSTAEPWNSGPPLSRSTRSSAEDDRSAHVQVEANLTQGLRDDIKDAEVPADEGLPEDDTATHGLTGAAQENLERPQGVQPEADLAELAIPRVEAANEMPAMKRKFEQDVTSPRSQDGQKRSKALNSCINGPDEGSRHEAINRVSNVGYVICETSHAEGNTHEQVEEQSPISPIKKESSLDFSGKEKDDFSLKNLLNRLMPVSPWSRLSRMAVGSYPIPMTEPGRALADSKEAAPISPTDEHERHLQLAVALSPRRAQASGGQDELKCPDKCTVLTDSRDRRHHESVSVHENEGSSARDMESESWQNPEARVEAAVPRGEPLEAMSPNLPTKNLRIELLKPDGASSHPFQTHRDDVPSVRPKGVSASVNTGDGNAAKGPPGTSSNTRAQTPEPQFICKSFASFLSPSPDRQRSLGHGRRGRGAMPSILKSRWRQERRPKSCVTWAENLQVFKSAADAQPGYLSTASSRTPSTRHGSPPPDGVIDGDLAEEDCKFSKHFEAVASRNESQHGTPRTRSMYNEAAEPESVTASESTEPSEAALGHQASSDWTTDAVVVSRASEEPMDVVEDMVREMGDFWDTWNLDAELDQARKFGTETAKSQTREAC